MYLGVHSYLLCRQNLAIAASGAFSKQWSSSDYGSLYVCSKQKMTARHLEARTNLFAAFHPFHRWLPPPPNGLLLYLTLVASPFEPKSDAIAYN